MWKFTKLLMSFFSTQLLYIFLAQTLHTFHKSSPSKCKFSDFQQLELKSTNFLMSFSNKKSVFLQTLHHSSVSWDMITLPYFFIYIFLCVGQKKPIKVQIFRLSTARMKINQISYVIFQATCQFSFKFCITFQCHDT